MAKRNDLKIQVELLEDIDKLEKKIAERGRATYNEQRRLNALKSASFEMASKELSLSKQIDNLEKSALGVINKKLGIDKQIKALQEAKKVGTKKELENANKLSSIMADVASGNKDFSDALNEIATEDFGKLNDAANDFAKTLDEGGKNLESQVKGAASLKDGFGGIAESLLGIDLSIAGLIAAVGAFALKIKRMLELVI